MLSKQYLTKGKIISLWTLVHRNNYLTRSFHWRKTNQNYNFRNFINRAIKYHPTFNLRNINSFLQVLPPFIQLRWWQKLNRIQITLFTLIFFIIRECHIAWILINNLSIPSCIDANCHVLSLFVTKKVQNCYQEKSILSVTN